MKTLLLIRHAKSSHSIEYSRDFDRELNERGHHDAIQMSDSIFKQGIKPDLIISSPANRAITTAGYFAEKFNYPNERIVQELAIYQDGNYKIINLIENIQNSYSTVFLFGHNPIITAIAEYLTHYNIDNIPTCGIACIDFETESWSMIQKKKGKLRFFDYPKKYSES